MKLTDKRLDELAKQAGVRFTSGWLDGPREALQTFAMLLVEEVEKMVKVEGEAYYLWPDGTYCEKHELEQMSHMSDDYQLVWVTEFDDEGEPMFPGGLR